MEKITLNVNGMSCGHCESAVKKALSELDGVKDVFVDLTGKTVTVEFEEISTEEIKNTIEDLGYDVV
ncbi:MAG: copper ion binding protein [Eubacteriales bacterium]|nr:copper ion binding protein [Eubacteriales bacterium]